MKLLNLSQDYLVQGGIEVKNDYNGEIFNKSPIGILIYDKKGKLVDVNPSALKIVGIPKEDASDINLFENTFIAQKRGTLTEGKLLRFQAPMYLETNKDSCTPLKSRTDLIDWTVSVIDSGFLVQIQDIDKTSQSEEKYRSFFEDDITGDFIATPGGRVLECNPAFAEIYGFDGCGKAVQWNISDFNPFDWPYMVTRLKSEGKIRGYQSWQRRSDGLRIHIVANVVGIFSDTGKLVQVKGYVFDDTERKNTEEELNRSKEQVMNILNSFKDGFVALNYYWKFIYVNQSAAQYFGLEPDDLIGQNLWEQFPELTGTTYETAFRRTRDEKEIQYFEAPGIRKDQLFDVSVYPLDEGISVCLRDINLHKKSEKKD